MRGSQTIVDIYLEEQGERIFEYECKFYTENQIEEAE